MASGKSAAGSAASPKTGAMRATSGPELTKLFTTSGQILQAAGLPILLLIVAGVGWLPLHTALWTSVWLLRDLWHFHFYGETPLALVKGRERTYFEHFWNDFAADRTKSVPEADRRLYAAAYAHDEGMRAGFEVFRAFEQDAKDFEGFAATRPPCSRWCLMTAILVRKLSPASELV